MKDQLRRYGLLTKLGTEPFFPTIGEAVDHYVAEHAVDWVDWVDWEDVR